MSNESIPSDYRHVRRLDTNTLLRLYDATQRAAGQSPFQQRRLNLQRCLRRVAKELRRRNESLPEESLTGASCLG